MQATNVIPLLGEMGVAQKGCRRAKVAPTTVKEWLAVLEMSAPSVTPLGRRATSPASGGGFKLHNKKRFRKKTEAFFYIACEANLATA